VIWFLGFFRRREISVSPSFHFFYYSFASFPFQFIPSLRSARPVTHRIETFAPDKPPFLPIHEASDALVFPT